MRYRPIAASAGLGFAFGGLFDGVLLHQILQWHHLVSLMGLLIWNDQSERVALVEARPERRWHL